MARNLQRTWGPYAQDRRYLTARTEMVTRGSDGMGGYYQRLTAGPRSAYYDLNAQQLGRFGRLGAYMTTPNDASTADVTQVTAASPVGAVVTTTSPSGSQVSTAPAVTPPSVLKQKIGATKGALGFLTWATNALPKPIAQAVMQAALARSISYRQSGGQLGVFGDTSDDSTLLVDPSTFTTPDLSTISPSLDPTTIDLTSVASNAAPSSSWTSAIQTAVTQAAAATLSAADAATVNSLTSTNLARAQAGQAPLAVAAGAGIGATAAGSDKTLLWGGAVVGVLLLLLMADK